MRIMGLCKNVEIWFIAHVLFRLQISTLKWHHNEHDGISSHQRLHCLPSCFFRHRSKKTSKLCLTGLCAGNSPVTGKFPAQKASYAGKCSRLMMPSCVKISTSLYAVYNCRVAVFPSYIHAWYYVLPPCISVSHHDGWQGSLTMKHIQMYPDSKGHEANKGPI